MHSFLRMIMMMIIALGFNTALAQGNITQTIYVDRTLTELSESDANSFNQGIKKVNSEVISHSREALIPEVFSLRLLSELDNAFAAPQIKRKEGPNLAIPQQFGATSEMQYIGPVSSHEYGHLVFQETMKKKYPEYAEKVIAETIAMRFQKVTFDHLAIENAQSEREGILKPKVDAGDKAATEEYLKIQNDKARYNKAIEKLEPVIKRAQNTMEQFQVNPVTKYSEGLNEFTADSLGIMAYDNNPDSISNALIKAFGEDAGKNRDFNDPKNKIENWTPQSDEHNLLAPTRYWFWENILSKPEFNNPKSKGLAFDNLLKVLDELYQNAKGQANQKMLLSFAKNIQGDEKDSTRIDPVKVNQTVISTLDRVFKENPLAKAQDIKTNSITYNEVPIKYSAEDPRSLFFYVLSQTGIIGAKENNRSLDEIVKLQNEVYKEYLKYKIPIPKDPAKYNGKQLGIFNNTLPSLGKFTAAAGIKDAFYVGVDALSGKSDGALLAQKMKDLVSSEQLAGYGAFSATATTLEKVGERVTKPILKSGLGAVVMASAMQADQIARSTMKNLDKGDDFTESLNKAVTSWKQSADVKQVGITVGAFMAARPAAQLTTDAGKAAWDLIKIRRAAQVAGTGAAAAQAGTGIGWATGTLTMAAELIIAEGILRSYQKLDNEDKIRSRLGEIDQLLSRMNESNYKSIYEKVGLKFTELRELRHAWTLENVPEVKKNYREFEDAFTEAYKTQNYFRKFKPGLLLQKIGDNKYKVFNPTKGQFEEDLNFNRCLADIQSIKTRSLQDPNCLSDTTICRHLTMMQQTAKVLGPKLKNLEEKRVKYLSSLQTSENQKKSDTDRMSCDFDSAIREKVTMEDHQVDIIKSDIGKLSMTDLYDLETVAYNSSLNKAQMKIEKGTDGKIHFTKFSQDQKPQIDPKNLLHEYSQAINATTASQEMLLGISPKNRLTEDAPLACDKQNAVDRLSQSVNDILSNTKDPFLSLLADEDLWQEANKNYNQGRKIKGTNAEQCTAQTLNCLAAESLQHASEIKNIQNGQKCSDKLKSFSEKDQEVLKGLKEFVGSYTK